jgi:hypothetical protein
MACRAARLADAEYVAAGLPPPRCYEGGSPTEYAALCAAWNAHGTACDLARFARALAQDCAAIADAYEAWPSSAYRSEAAYLHDMTRNHDGVESALRGAWHRMQSPMRGAVAKDDGPPERYVFPRVAALTAALDARAGGAAAWRGAATDRRRCFLPCGCAALPGA